MNPLPHKPVLKTWKNNPFKNITEKVETASSIDPYISPFFQDVFYPSNNKLRFLNHIFPVVFKWFELLYFFFSKLLHWVHF